MPKAKSPIFNKTNIKKALAAAAFDPNEPSLSIILDGATPDYLLRRTNENLCRLTLATKMPASVAKDLAQQTMGLLAAYTILMDDPELD